MAISIKRTPELWGIDAERFNEIADHNGRLETPKLNDRQKAVLNKMLESGRAIQFPPLS